MPGTIRLLRISVLLPALSMLVLGFTMPWRGVGVADLLVAILVLVALLPAVMTFSPWAYQLLRRDYLPVALGMYLLCQTLLSSLLHNWGLVRFDLVQIGSMHFIEPGVLLMIPALLIAWQYGWQGALLAATITGSLHLATGLIVHWLMSDLAHLAPVTPLVRPDLLYFLPLTIAYLGTLLRKQQRQQRRAQVQLREYAATAEVLAADRERNRLAKQLQNTLARSLAAVSEQLETIGAALRLTPDAAAEKLAIVQEQVHSDFRETQRVIEDLRSRSLEEMEIVAAIEARANELTQQGIQVDFAFAGPQPALTQEQAVVLYRVADKVLSEAAQHPGVQQVSLQLLCFDHQVALTIHDDGEYQPPNTDASNHELEECIACAELIGGQICIDGEQGQGNTVALWMPCGPEPD